MLHTGWWPTFNVADAYITTGVAWWTLTTNTPTDNAGDSATSTAETPTIRHRSHASDDDLAFPKRTL